MRSKTTAGDSDTLCRHRGQVAHRTRSHSLGLANSAPHSYCVVHPFTPHQRRAIYKGRHTCAERAIHGTGSSQWSNEYIREA